MNWKSLKIWKAKTLILKVMKGLVAKFRIEQSKVFRNLIFDKVSLWFWGVLEKQTSMAESHLAKKQNSLVFNSCAQPDQGRRHRPPSPPPPPHVFGKPKYPIVNTYKSWFSSPHIFRNRSKFWNQSWVCYPSCHPPFRINISFLMFWKLFVLLWCWYMYLN